MKKCPKCGNLIQNDSAIFCKVCGTKLSEYKHVSMDLNSDEIKNTPSQANTNDDGGITLNNDISNHLDLSNEKSISSEPKDYLLVSILSTLFCCVPFGIYAIICSSRVDKYYRAGNYTDSLKQSKKAKKWSIVSFGLGLAVWIMYLIIVVAGTFVQQNLSDTAFIEDSIEENNTSNEIDLAKKNNIFLEEAIKEGRSTLPIDIGSGMRMTDMKISGEYVLYDITCDEELIDISLINGNEAKINILNNLKNNNLDDVQHLIKLCKQAHKGIAYKYKGNSSGKSTVVRISYIELIELNN